MARGVCFVVAVAAALGIGVVIGGTQRQAGAVGPAIENGDVNGDGDINIADAVYLLTYLFQSGPEPIPMGTMYPSTGLTQCYDTSGTIVTCAGSGQDGEYQIGCQDFEPQIIDGDDVVVDHCTRLMWQRIAPTFQLPWEESIGYCETLGVAGFTDWRMPNLKELMSIIDYDEFDPSVDPILFPSTQLLHYWTSTTFIRQPEYVWWVDMCNGGAVAGLKALPAYVRAVRNVTD